MSSRLKRCLASLLMAGILTTIPAMAQEGGREAAETHEKSGEQEGLAIWQWLNFAILAGLLGWMIRKNVGPMLVARSREIQEGLAAGEKAKAEADARAAAVDARLAGLAQTVAGMKASAREERDREAARLRQSTQDELARMKSHVASEIESAGKLARLEVQRQAAKLAIELAEQKVKARMTPEAETRLLGRFLSDVAKTAPQVNQ
ncbi:MAG TPA: hypothetical protein VNH18_32565 [Bryobacteraceae bacterium]|nr:hypothetical protein [Bryobacteraceae bacterium]